MEDINKKIDTFTKKLLYFESWEDRYKQLIAFSKKMPLLEEEDKSEELLIKGCLSKVWLHCEVQSSNDSKRLFFKADSDAIITKGIIALLVLVYNGQTPKEILENPPTFLEKVGINEHLSMNRRNGLVNMVERINQFAQENS